MFSKLCMIAALLVAALSVVSAHWYQSYVTPYVTGYGGGMYYGGDSDGKFYSLNILFLKSNLKV